VTADLAERLATMTMLAEPLRRALYVYVAAQRRPVSRAEAAAAQKVSRTVAAFHLDKLAEAGLLEVTQGRTTNRRGPGSGRPAVLYMRGGRQHEVSIPPRSYALASRLLADAVDRSGADRLLHEAAEREGVRQGKALAGRAAAAKDQLEGAARVLEGLGYEPRAEGDELRLQNCPFHELSRANPPLICGMNLALLTGMATGLGLETLAVRMDPRPGQCCVAISTSNIS
jgi:predicted ArsR family transcriptional regulator